MNLKKNILANYFSQIYVTLIGIAIIPLYLKYMGSETYGLIGFFTMLQAWFNLLDLGLSPTISRESARYHGGAMSALDYRRLFRALSLIFFTIALLGGFILWFLSDAVATRWLKVETLPHHDVVLAVQIMAISVALRWMSGLYRGVVSGAERLVWLSSFTAVIATIRFGGVFCSMWVWGFTPRVFFLHQLVVAGLELLGLFLMSQKLIPRTKYFAQPIGWSFSPVQSSIRFALGIAFTSAIWVMMTQIDKLILSGILTLSQFGSFSIATTIASGIMTLCSPITTPTTARITNLYAQSKIKEAIDNYKFSTVIVTIAATSTAGTLLIFSHEIILLFSNSTEIANYSSATLSLYSIGYFFVALGAFPSYLQNATGNLRLHIIGNIIALVLIIPSMYFSANMFGAIGAGITWAIVNSFYFFLWVWYSHKKLMPGLHRVWITECIIKYSLPGLITLSILYAIKPTNIDFYIMYIPLTWILAVGVMIMQSSQIKLIINSKWKK